MCTIGFFSSGKKNLDKMSDSEKTTLFKTLQTFLSKKGWWTTEWLTKNGIAFPEDENSDEKRLAEIQQQLDEKTSLLEKKEQEIAALTERYEADSAKEQELQQRIAEKEKQLNELDPIGRPAPAVNTDELKTELQEGLKLILETLSGKIDQENGALIRTLDKVEDKLMRKEADLQSFQEDSRLKATAPYLKQFINLGDMMRKVIDENPSAAEESASYLLEQFKRLTDSIDFILRDFSVEAFRRDEADTTFDPHTQQAFEYPTDNAALDKKIRRTINPGYVWTLPYILKAKANGEEHPLKEYRMIFRREQVECFKYLPKESEN